MSNETVYEETQKEIEQTEAKIKEAINTFRLNLGSIKIDKKTKDLVDRMEAEYPEMTTEFKKIVMSYYIVFLGKQSDYGPANIAMNTGLKTESEKKMSMIGLVTRMNDKMSRLINLVFKNRIPNNESILDSFKDISIYGIIARIVDNGKWGK